MDVRYDFGGDEYIFVDFDIEMSLEVNFKVLSICQDIERDRIPGVIEVCPGNASYLVHYRPEEVEPDKLVKELRGREHQADRITSISSRMVDIPVLYDDPWTKECAKQFGDRHQDASVTNLEYLTRINGFSDKQEFIQAHSGRPYWISMVGFVPGTAWGYQMVPRARALQAPKYIRPRTDTPERTVSHGGAFIAIYPVRGPGGYQLIGMTPVPVYEPEGRLVDLRETRILAKAADRWQLRPIDRGEFDAIRTAVEAGTYRYGIIEQEFRPAVYLEDPERYLNRLQEEARTCSKS
jgi:allophanate hydrolase subunit 1